MSYSHYLYLIAGLMRPGERRAGRFHVMQTPFPTLMRVSRAYFTQGAWRVLHHTVTTPYLTVCFACPGEERAERVQSPFGSLLHSSRVQVRSELDVFTAARIWIEHSRHDRMKMAGELMGCVRFLHMSPEDIVRHVEPHVSYFEGLGGHDVLLGIYRLVCFRRRERTGVSLLWLEVWNRQIGQL